MGLTSSNANSKPASVLPILGKGEYTHIGCADLMIASESDNDPGLFARIFYPSSPRIDTVILWLIFNTFTCFSEMTPLFIQYGSREKSI